MRFTPTTITLPSLAILLCWTEPVEEASISILAPVSAAVTRPTEGEIDDLLRRAKAGFEGGDAAPPLPKASEGPRWEMEVRWPGASVRCSHALLASGTSELLRAVEEGRRQAFTRLDWKFREFLRWQEEEDFPWDRLWCEEVWDISLATGTLLSLRGQVSEYSGGAHGNYWFETRTVGMGRTGARILTLHDLFLRDCRWRMELSRRILAQLSEAEAQWVVAGEIDFADEELLQDWTLTETALVFDFAPYEVSSYSSGAFQVRIDFEDLNGLLDPEGPLRLLLR